MLVKVRVRTVRAIIDTGAISPCVSVSLVRRLQLLEQIVPASRSQRLFTADDNAMEVNETVSFSVNIRGVIVPFTFYVTVAFKPQLDIRNTF